MPKDEGIDLDALNQRINDKSWAVDRSGVAHKGVPHQGQNLRKTFQKMMPSSSKLQCPECRGDRFMIFCSNIDEAVQFRCGNARCDTWWKPAGLHKLQMTDAIAKSLGLWLPEVVPDGRYQELEGWEQGDFNDLVEEQRQ